MGWEQNKYSLYCKFLQSGKTLWTNALSKEKEYLYYKKYFCAKDGNLIKYELKVRMICISLRNLSMTSDWHLLNFLFRHISEIEDFFFNSMFQYVINKNCCYYEHGIIKWNPYSKTNFLHLYKKMLCLPKTIYCEKLSWKTITLFRLRPSRLKFTMKSISQSEWFHEN